MGKKESIEDTARVLGRFYDGIEFRGFAQTDVEDLAENAGVPVWNGLTTEWHPTQMLADILTVQENFNYDIKGCLLYTSEVASLNPEPTRPTYASRPSSYCPSKSELIPRTRLADCVYLSLIHI